MNTKTIPLSILVTSMIALSACGGGNPAGIGTGGNSTERTGDASSFNHQITAVTNDNFIAVAESAWSASLRAINKNQELPLRKISDDEFFTEATSGNVICAGGGSRESIAVRQQGATNTLVAGDYDEDSHSGCSQGATTFYNGSHRVDYKNTINLPIVDQSGTLIEFPIAENSDAVFTNTFTNESFAFSENYSYLDGVFEHNLSNAIVDTIKINSGKVNYLAESEVSGSTERSQVKSTFDSISFQLSRETTLSTYQLSQGYTGSIDWGTQTDYLAVNAELVTVSSFNGTYSEEEDPFSDTNRNRVVYEYPSSGEALITTDDAIIKISVQSEDVIQISLDTNKDGVYEFVEEESSFAFYDSRSPLKAID